MRSRIGPLAVPMWIFRIIEQDVRRTDQLKAGLRSVMTLGVVAPALLAAPVQWTVIRQDVVALASTILTFEDDLPTDVNPLRLMD